MRAALVEAGGGVRPKAHHSGIGLRRMAGGKRDRPAYPQGANPNGFKEPVPRSSGGGIAMSLGSRHSIVLFPVLGPPGIFREHLKPA